MIYKTYELTGEQLNPIRTEILFTVASARSLGVEILHYGFSHSDDERLQARRLRFASNVLRDMKKNGKIQLYATKESFENSTVEAEYLLNKYEEPLELMKIIENGGFILVKI